MYPYRGRTVDVGQRKNPNNRQARSSSQFPLATVEFWALLPIVYIVLAPLTIVNCDTMKRSKQAVLAQKPRVRFSKMSEMRIIANLSESPFKGDLWFTKAERACFKANMVSSAAMARFCISEGYALKAGAMLGLERLLTKPLADEYKFRHDKLMAKVLNWARLLYLVAYDRGSIFQTEMADFLAGISAENSKWSMEQARTAALFLVEDLEREKAQYAE